VVIKYIADPTMHSMPSVAMHPNNNWIACQSMDNQIVVYSTKERFRVNHKKVFSGHHNAGYVRRGATRYGWRYRRLGWGQWQCCEQSPVAPANAGAEALSPSS
jgi:pre-mRNA-processing factor 17